jgi:hypothetical protein
MSRVQMTTDNRTRAVLFTTDGLMFTLFSVSEVVFPPSTPLNMFLQRVDRIHWIKCMYVMEI